MLDLMKIAQQMQGISQHLTQEAEAARRRVIIANQLMDRAKTHQDALLEQWERWCDRIGFTVAQPIEPLDSRIPLQAAPEAHTVLATDGSQIAPSHHEIAYCYLLNIGRIVLHYGQSRYPLLDSLPEVVYRPEDLYMSRQWGISTEEWMGHRRTVAEAVVLGELARAVRAEGGARGAELGEGQRATPRGQGAENRKRSAASSEQPTTRAEQKVETGQLSLLAPPSSLLPAPPTLALVDGSLIYWFLDQMPGEARDDILPPILEAWEVLRQLRIPLVGYLSASRSGEALNFLRLQACPYEQPDCVTHCSGQTDAAPCQVFSPLKDVTYWATALEPGQRGPLWQSSAPILNFYGEHRIFFCYVHVGAEVARLEVPAWVVEDRELLETALQLTLTQVQKGYGYPVALAEAHNQAVVRGGDRTRFFALLEREMIRAGLKNVGTSYKEARKRGSIA